MVNPLTKLKNKQRAERTYLTYIKTIEKERKKERKNSNMIELKIE